MLAGAIARGVPAGWRWPEKMAARSLALSMWGSLVFLLNFEMKCVRTITREDYPASRITRSL